MGHVNGIQTYRCTSAWGHELNNIMSTTFTITLILLSSRSIVIFQCTTESTSETYLKKYGIFMVFLSFFTNACIALAMYNDTLTLALLLKSVTSLLNYFCVMPLYISKSFLKLMVCLA
jgi:hypothetical protein